LFKKVAVRNSQSNLAKASQVYKQKMLAFELEQYFSIIGTSQLKRGGAGSQTPTGHNSRLDRRPNTVQSGSRRRNIAKQFLTSSEAHNKIPESGLGESND
jgi:hypothetical protein